MPTQPQPAPGRDTTALLARRIRFEWPADLPVTWNPRFPELCAAANGVSMLMPYVEPWVVRTVRDAAVRTDDPTGRSDDGTERETVRTFLAQETQHHLQHRRFNELVVPQVRGLARVERWMQRMCGWLSRRGDRFGLAFAAAFETIAYALARWTASHSRRLLDGADARVATLFMWHLAEEVEHKGVVFDLHRRSGGSRAGYLLAGAVAVVVLSWCTWWATIVMLVAQHRWWHPVAWWRLTVWGLSLAFEVLPDLVVTALPGHQPADLVDPLVLTTWLASYDDATATMPLWWTGAAA